jgi:hypothetical protein
MMLLGIRCLDQLAHEEAAMTTLCVAQREQPLALGLLEASRRFEYDLRDFQLWRLAA